MNFFRCRNRDTPGASLGGGIVPKPAGGLTTLSQSYLTATSKGYDIYYSERGFESAVKKLFEADLFPEDKDLILSYVTSKRAQGVKPIRLKKIVGLLRTFALQIYKPLKVANKQDIENFLCYLEEKNYSGWTKSDYKVIVKTFYNWMWGEDSETPYLVKWIKNKEPKDSILPEDLLTEDEVMRLVSVAKFIRDKSFIFLLWEAGIRVGEILTLRIKHITFAEPVSSVLVNGKTGQRRIPIIKCVPLLKEWIKIHPLKDYPDALVWIKTNERKGNFRIQGERLTTSELSYSSVKKLLAVNFKLAKINKPSNPHQFRHSRATFLAQHLTEAQLKQFFGWTQSSDCAGRYVHLSGRDLDSTILKISDLERVL